jgi:Cu(I)/Ag(I) efflux system membrane protein CusA/SilA
LNENQIKPALQSRPGVAEVASVGGLEKQYQLKVFPPLLAETGLSLRQVVSALQNAFQEAGGRTVEVTNRDYQIRGVVNNDNIDEPGMMVLGRGIDGKPVHLRDIGYIQVATTSGAASPTSTVRRGRRRHRGHGAEANVLEVTRASIQSCRDVKQRFPTGVESCHL